MSMSLATIIEDNSPYYVRFKIDLDQFNAVRDVAINLLQSKSWPRPFVSEPVSPEDCAKIVSAVPSMFKWLELSRHRINLFVANPGYYGVPHKDGPNMLFGVNFTIKISDDKCVTKWYSDDKLKDYTFFNGMKFNGRQFRPLREITDFEPNDEVPDMSMIALESECVLFNVGMFHDFDNSKSSNQRVVLTLRQVSETQMTFQDARDILLNVLAKSS